MVFIIAAEGRMVTPLPDALALWQQEALLVEEVGPCSWSDEHFSQNDTHAYLLKETCLQLIFFIF